MKKENETMERLNLWKHVLVSVLWSLLALSVCGFIFEASLKVMTKASTMLFICGFVGVAFSVITSFFVFDYHIFKLRKLYRVKSTEEKQESENKENKPNEGNS
jgi:hypothetical protein